MQAEQHHWLCPREVAAQLGVSPVTVRLWSREGKLDCSVTAGGHRRFRQQDVDAFQHRLTQKKSRQRSILIIDNDRQHAELLKNFINDLPFTADSYIAHDGFEAGRLLAQYHPEIVLLDLKMPGMDGFAVCQRIKQQADQQAVRIIAISGYDTAENTRRILAAGAEHCLSKPIKLSELAQLLST
jgi:excisionase family DNA binding protein